MRKLLLLLLASTSLLAQAPRNDKQASAPTKTTILNCAKFWDGRSDSLRSNVSVVIDGDRIKDVVSGAPTEGGEVVNAAGTCMPGLIETHTHVLLQSDITAQEYDDQIFKESIAYRTLRASRSLRLALKYGFTTIRDLETEGAGYADVDLRKAVNAGVVPGPRMQVAGRAMDVTGAYGPNGYDWQLEPHLTKGVQEVDGVEGGRKAVREQISYGVDWIKVYSDRTYFLRPDGVLDDTPTFTLDELKAIVDETHREHRKIASHAMALNGVHNSVEAGVDSVEHGDYIADADLATMKAKGIYYVPTLFVGEYVAEGRGGVWPKMVAVNQETVRRAMKAGVKIAFGTDVGGFSWDIDPAVQFQSLVKLGMTPRQAIQTSILTGAELLGLQNDIGSLEKGKYADIIVVDGDPLSDIAVVQKVVQTVKGGVLYTPKELMVGIK
jgi:imidazolonepropionase-like amidohydrolase